MRKMYIINLGIFYLIFSVAVVLAMIFAVQYPLTLRHLGLLLIVVPVYGIGGRLIYNFIKRANEKCSDYDEKLSGKSDKLKVIAVKILDKAFIFAAILLIMQLHNFIVCGLEFYEIYMSAFNVIFSFIAVFILTWLHGKLLLSGRFGWAGAVPLVGLALYALGVFALFARDNAGVESRLVRYIFDGTFMYIRNDVRAIIFVAFVVLYASAKAICLVRKSNLA